MRARYQALNARFLSVNVTEKSTELGTRSSRQSLLSELVHKGADQKREVELAGGFSWTAYLGHLAWVQGLGRTMSPAAHDRHLVAVGPGSSQDVFPGQWATQRACKIIPAQLL